MKKIISLALLFLASVSFAGERMIPQVTQCVFKSSYTATADTAKYISNSKYIDGIIVSSASAGGWIKIYNSTFTAAGQLIPAIDLSTVGYWPLHLVVSGLTYTTSGNTNGIAIIYREKE